MPPVLSARVVEQCRVVVDNDFAGDPDGVLALAHHLLSPSNRVVAITSSFLNPQFVVPPATPGATAQDGSRLATALLAELGLADPPPVHTGAERPFDGAGPSAAADAIVAAAHEESDLPLFVVCAGPLTNVAAALALDPGVAERMTLIWIGGSRDPEAFEYNRDTDPAAADAVFAVAGLEIHQFPLETYRRCAYSIAELETDLPATGQLGAWLFERFSSPPEWVRLGGVWPIGDSPPLLITALTTDSSTRFPVTPSSPPARPSPADGVTVQLYTDVDMRLLVGDLLAKLRMHEQGQSST